MITYSWPLIYYTSEKHFENSICCKHVLRQWKLLIISYPLPWKITCIYYLFGVILKKHLCLKQKYSLYQYWCMSVVLFWSLSTKIVYDNFICKTYCELHAKRMLKGNAFNFTSVRLKKMGFWTKICRRLFWLHGKTYDVTES